MSHWCKWKITLENIFQNRGMEWRLSSISFGRFESSRGGGSFGKKKYGKVGSPDEIYLIKKGKRKGTFLKWSHHEI
jgi:hypothetical protein